MRTSPPAPLQCLERGDWWRVRYEERSFAWEKQGMIYHAPTADRDINEAHIALCSRTLKRPANKIKTR
jgi:hypothetical protein